MLPSLIERTLWRWQDDSEDMCWDGWASKMQLRVVESDAVIDLWHPFNISKKEEFLSFKTLTEKGGGGER